MNRLIVVSLLVLMVLPCVNAAPGPATNPCDSYRHGAVVAIVGQIAVGDNEAWSGLNGPCAIMHSATQAVLWTGVYNGPAIAGAATITWAVGTAFTGCTIGTITQIPNVILGAANSVASATVTMTSTECRGTITLAIVIPGIYTWNAIFPINLRVEQPNQMFLCGNTGVTNNAFNPATNSCGANALTVHQDPLSGMITVDNTGGQTLTVHQDPISGTLTIEGIDVSNVTVNQTSNNDFAEVVLNWFPLWFGFVCLFVAIWRHEGLEPNALLGAGVSFWVAMITCPFPPWDNPIGIAYRVMLFALGFWTTMKWTDYRKTVPENVV